MKVELEGSLRTALLKGCLWMGKSELSIEEGEQDEASEQPKLPLQLLSTTNTYLEERPSKFCYPQKIQVH